MDPDTSHDPVDRAILTAHQSLILDLSECNLDDDAIAKVVDNKLLDATNQSLLRTLKAINLSQNKIAYEGAKHISTLLSHAPSLRTFLIAGNPLGSSGFQVLAQPLLQVADVDFRACGITSDGIAWMGSILRSLTHANRRNSLRRLRLRSLQLSGNPISNNGAVLLANALSVWPSCETLELMDCKIGDVGATQLAENIASHPQLKVVDLRVNLLTEDGVVALSVAASFNKQLERVDVSSNYATTFELKHKEINDTPTSLVVGVQKSRDPRELAIHLEEKHFEDIGEHAGEIGALENQYYQWTTKYREEIDESIIELLQHMAEGFFVDVESGLLSMISSLEWSRKPFPISAAKVFAAVLKYKDCISALRLQGIPDINIDDAVVPIVSMLHHNRTLRVLDLSGTTICNGSDSSALWGVLGDVLRADMALLEVDLSHTGMGDEELMLLERGLMDNTSIQSLFLEGNNFTVEASFPLYNILVNNVSLIELSVNDNPALGNDTLKEIVSALPATLNSNLQILKIENCGLHGKEAGVLIRDLVAADTPMQHLFLDRNELQIEAVRECVAALPNNSHLRTLSMTAVGIDPADDSSTDFLATVSSSLQNTFCALATLFIHDRATNLAPTESSSPAKSRKNAPSSDRVDGTPMESSQSSPTVQRSETTTTETDVDELMDSRLPTAYIAGDYSASSFPTRPLQMDDLSTANTSVDVSQDIVAADIAHHRTAAMSVETLEVADVDDLLKRCAWLGDDADPAGMETGDILRDLQNLQQLQAIVNTRVQRLSKAYRSKQEQENMQRFEQLRSTELDRAASSAPNISPVLGSLLHVAPAELEKKQTKYDDTYARTRQNRADIEEKMTQLNGRHDHLQHLDDEIEAGVNRLLALDKEIRSLMTDPRHSFADVRNGLGRIEERATEIEKDRLALQEQIRTLSKQKTGTVEETVKDLHSVMNQLRDSLNLMYSHQRHLLDLMKPLVGQAVLADIDNANKSTDSDRHGGTPFTEAIEVAREKVQSLLKATSFTQNLAEIRARKKLVGSTEEEVSRSLSEVRTRLTEHENMVTELRRQEEQLYSRLQHTSRESDVLALQQECIMLQSGLSSLPNTLDPVSPGMQSTRMLNTLGDLSIFYESLCTRLEDQQTTMEEYAHSYAKLRGEAGRWEKRVEQRKEIARTLREYVYSLERQRRAQKQVEDHQRRIEQLDSRAEQIQEDKQKAFESSNPIRFKQLEEDSVRVFQERTLLDEQLSNHSRQLDACIKRTELEISRARDVLQHSSEPLQASIHSNVLSVRNVEASTMNEAIRSLLPPKHR